MNKKKILNFKMLLFCIIFILTTIISSAQDLDNENFGKVRGWIVDPETGNSVDEVFVVDFWYANHEGLFDSSKIHSVQSDQNGSFETLLPPGSYILRFRSKLQNSKYCSYEPNPKKNDSFRYIIKIERDKTTEIRKIASIGGSLKIIIEDNSGNQINFKEKFPLVQPTVTASLKNPDFFYSIILPENALIISENGVITENSLFPGVYTLDFSFIGLGFPKVIKEGIRIEKGKVAIVRIPIDISNLAGIEGRISDKNGISLANCLIFFSKPGSQKEPIIVDTNRNGEYHVIGMSSGIYKIAIHSSQTPPLRAEVEVISGKIIRRDFTLDFSYSD